MSLNELRFPVAIPDLLPIPLLRTGHVQIRDFTLQELQAYAVANTASLTAEIAALRQKISENELMAECTVMLRDDLIAAGIVDKAVPPMMLTEAILKYVVALRKDADRHSKSEALDAAVDAALVKVVQP